jgi:tetratricopeptide (TPR) repeat protein
VLSLRTRVVGVRAFSAERDEPWSLVRSIVRELLAYDVTVTAELPGSIRSALGWLVPELTHGTAGTAPDAESRKALLLEALIRMLTQAGSPLVIDDLQWADGSSLAVIATVLDRLDNLTVVLAYRSDEARARADVAALVDQARGRTTHIPLLPLAAAEIAELTTDEQLAHRLANQTDGTPLAVAEVLRALAAEGAIVRTSQSRWRPANARAIERAGELALDGQRRAIALRSEGQQPLAREVLGLLSLLVREVPARLLALASGAAERAVLDALATLSACGLARLGEQGWAAGHDMVAEVVADCLSPSERGRLHAHLAEALDASGADAGELAQHWLGAGDLRRAAEAYLRAATQAMRAFANGEASALADAGLAISPAADVSAALSEVRAQTRARTGDLTGARDDLRAALQALPSGPARARVLGQLATLASGADDLRRAAELAELAIVEAGSVPESQARALEIAAVLDMNLDRPQRSEQRAAQALALYQQIGDATGTARILDGRAMATFLDGRIERGGEELERVANLFEDSGDLIRVITPRSTAGHALVFGGDAQAGLARATAALELSRTLGNPEGQSYSQWHAAEALAALGRAEEALTFGQCALAVAQEVGHRGWMATAWRAIGIAHQTRGELGAALLAFTSSLELSENLNLFACWAASRAALVLVAASRTDEAAPFVARALAQGPPLGRYEARLAEVELAAARDDPGTTALARVALDLADAGGMRQNRSRLVELAG